LRYWRLPNQIKMFFHLKDLKINDIFRKAGSIIDKNGFSKSLLYDPYTKEVDISGAIFLACGASKKLLIEGETDPDKLGMAEANCVRSMVAIEYVEAMVGKNTVDWSAESEKYEAISLLNRLADRIDISIAKGTT